MKERIEQKLGCSIDEYIERWEQKMISDRKNDWETEERNDAWNLTEEERRFIMEYYKTKTA